ncbi:MAG TPA: SIMPL domain-containing protein, partial [Pyrinomonadaceae bacterium]|nr:SIMPL domain-containing protein [Pyrinomonadaceae bacterium]
MKNEIYRFAALGGLLILLGAALYIYRPVENRLTRVAVLGDAETAVEPDTAIITLSVVTEAKQALAAQQENARRSEAVGKAVEEAIAGAQAEIKTGNYTLSPQRDYYSDIPKIKAYSARNTITVSIGALDKVGAVIDAATAAGANSVEGIEFAVAGDGPGQGSAVAAATDRAMGKAEAVAASLGGRIVRVVQSTEGGIDPAHIEVSYEAKSSYNTAAKLPMTPVR